MMLTNERGELVIRASLVTGTAQFQGEYSLPMEDIEVLDMPNNDLTDDLLKQVVDVLVAQRPHFVRMYRVDLRWNRLTKRCKEHVVRLLSAFGDKVLVDVRHNSMSFKEMDTEFRGIKESVEYKDEITCTLQERNTIGKQIDVILKELAQSTKELSKSTMRLERAAKNRSEDMERSIEYVLLNHVTKDGYECDSLTDELHGGKLCLPPAILKEIPHVNDIVSGKDKNQLDFKTKVERTVEYLRHTLPMSQGTYRRDDQRQVQLFSRYTTVPLVFVYASGLMHESIKTKLEELRATFSQEEKYEGLGILSAESPRLTECILTDYSPLPATTDEGTMLHDVV
eukprot:gene32743-39583_t